MAARGGKRSRVDPTLDGAPASAAPAGGAGAETKEDGLRPIVWSPSSELLRTCRMAGFMRHAAAKTGRSFATYHDLWAWSVEDLETFWRLVWDFLDVHYTKPFSAVLANTGEGKRFQEAQWFPGARLNFAQNLLRFRDDSLAYIAQSDASREPVTMTYAALYDEVARLARALRAMGVTKGDRVGGILPNMAQAGVAMLATVSIGALWSSCSPDFGVHGVMDRFGQIEPKVVFIADGYYYKGKRIDSVAKFRELPERIASLERVVVVNYASPEHVAISITDCPKAVHYADFLSPPAMREEIEFEQVAFDHPVYIMYSSGTTGLPKCIVQGSGVLLNHLKELVLHADVGRGDRLFYTSTCGWMMWNWLTSGLATGCALILYDGMPLYPEAGRLFRMAQELKITHFGCSAKYLHLVEGAGVVPKRDYDLSAMRCIMSTGSPSTSATFDYVYGSIKADVQFASISGGTDLNGCFALGTPLLPVRRPELQCRGLGMKVNVYDVDSGKAVVGQQGELVCEAPFPSMPLFFWNDEGGEKYRKAYFAHIDGVWRHGDFAELTAAGGMVIYGRSDATLNPGGVRIGTSELYRVAEGLPWVADTIVIGQTYKDDVRVVMFVKMKEGAGELTDKHRDELRREIRKEVSPRHVPAVIVQCPDIPYTLSGKKVELAVRDLVAGRSVPQKDALANPASLEFYKDVPELK